MSGCHWSWVNIYGDISRYIKCLNFDYGNKNSTISDKNLLKARKLNCGDESNPCDVYNSMIDPSSMVEFANGAFKFFHINVPEKIHV